MERKRKETTQEKRESRVFPIHGSVTQRFSRHWILTNVFVTQADHFVID